MGKNAYTSAVLADFAQLSFVDYLDASSVHDDQTFRHERGKRSDGVAGGHIRQIRQIFARHIYAQRSSIVLISVILEKSNEGFG